MGKRGAKLSKMVKRMIMVLISVFIISALSGCWDSQDLVDLDIPLVIVYDPSQLDESSMGLRKIDVGVLIPNVDANARGKSRVETTSAITVGSTRIGRAYISPKNVVVGMNQAALVNEELAAAGMNAIVDSIYRTPQSPHTVVMAVTEGSAVELLKTPEKNNVHLGVFLLGLLRDATKRDFQPITDLREFSKESSTRGRNPIVVLLKVENGQVGISGTGIFNKDKLIAKANLDETRSLVLLRGINASGYLPFILTQDGEITDKGTVKVKNKRKVTVERNGDELTFKVDISLEGSMLEHASEKLLTEDSQLLNEIEEQVADNVESECNTFIKKMQEDYKVDCIAITPYALAKWRQELQDKVDEGFIEKVHIIVDVKVKLKAAGDLK